MISIRRAAMEDLAAILAFCEESEHAPRWTAEAWRKAIEHAIVLVAEEDGVCGVIVAADVAGVASIDNLVVAQRKHRRGIGRMLIKSLVDEAEAQGIQALELEVNERNVVAIGLYSSMGFVEQGRRKRYYAGVDDAVLMGLQLPDLAGR